MKWRIDPDEIDAHFTLYAMLQDRQGKRLNIEERQGKSKKLKGKRENDKGKMR